MVINKYTSSRKTTLEEINFGQISYAKKIHTFLETGGDIILEVSH